MTTAASARCPIDYQTADVAMPSPQPISIVPASWTRDRERIHQIRYTVFVLEQQVPEQEEWDDADVECHHILALTGAGEAVGTARMQASGKIGRVAVLKPWRGYGIGGQMLQYMLELASREGIPRVYLHAQQSSVPFYERFGFQPTGDPFMEANIPHQRMERLM